MGLFKYGKILLPDKTSTKLPCPLSQPNINTHTYIVLIFKTVRYIPTIWTVHYNLSKTV